MRFLGGALTRWKIAGGCIVLLGGTTFTGLVCTEIYKDGVSSALAKLGGWVVQVFNWVGSASPPSAPSTPLDPITPITQAWDKVSGWATMIAGAFPEGYKWVKESDNAQFLATFLKSFWNLSFAKNVVFNLHLTIRAWLGVLFDSDALSKFPDAFQTFKVLAKFLSKKEVAKNGNKDMINWLYLRLMVNPRRTINVLKRGSKNGSVNDENQLKCNGATGRRKKKKENTLPLGVCFICREKDELIEHMKKFLTEGSMPPATPKETK
ncbi:hypothetical protein OVS_02795 [Mycoplasma ovis str. Michigan]|uniref:Uncharacterized protein n=1 Tax=Mycoplasma ovis str. Michigan TaxID=1415773 RepID=A0ABN4BS32_9MOLU|nr:hypothetical protein [Mycoplasma ovis]AHC40358.1 hypothetical protein OVS_02795 [Mycoplasma ovis str. Michigan]